MGSFGVHRLRPHFGGDHNVIPPQCFSHFLSIFILYPPTGSLPVHRIRRLLGEEPKLIPRPLFLLFVNQDQNMYYSDRMYQCMYWKICRFSSTHTLISKRWPLTLFEIQTKAGAHDGDPCYHHDCMDWSGRSDQTKRFLSFLQPFLIRLWIILHLNGPSSPLWVPAFVLGMKERRTHSSPVKH